MQQVVRISEFTGFMFLGELTELGSAAMTTWWAS
jgi:hypothetical protein